MGAGLIDVAALAILLGRPGPTAPLVAAAVHLAAVLPFVVRSQLTVSERVLGASFVFGLPVVGAPLAALAVMTVGQGELLAAPADEPEMGEETRADELRRLGEALPCCEALLAGQVEERRAIIATLTRRADADAVALLRWALGAPDPELAVEAALALEEMASSFETDLASARKRVADAGSGAADEALAAAELITDAIDSGIADPALVGPARPRGPRVLRTGGQRQLDAGAGDRQRARAARAGGASSRHRARLHRRGVGARRPRGSTDADRHARRGGAGLARAALGGAVRARDVRPSRPQSPPAAVTAASRAGRTA